MIFKLRQVLPRTSYFKPMDIAEALIALIAKSRQILKNGKNKQLNK